MRIHNSDIILTQGDITKQTVDAIVNAANSTLLGGGGVDGAIHRAGGPAILAECKQIRQTLFPEGLPAGEAVQTTAGDLPARFVIHTVGPIWRGGARGEAETLARAYQSSLALAADLGAQSIAFPSISTGAYGYPKVEAARVALTTVIAFLEGETTLREVRFVLFSEEDYTLFNATLNTLRTTL